MADEFATTLFTEARAHHEAARRWFCIAAAALAIFHLMIFRPYVDFTEKKTEVANTLSQDSSLKQELEGLGQALAQLSALSTEEAKGRLDGLLGDLRSTFGQLNNIISKLSSMGPDDAYGEPGEQLFFATEDSSPMVVQTATPIANAMAQTAAAPTPIGSYLPPMDGALRRGIASANSHHSVLELIQPYIEQAIIAPRFSHFNESWQEEVAPGVASIGDTVLLRIRTAGLRFPREAASWTSVEQAVSDVMNAAGQFKIEMPSEPFWWAAVESKGAAVHGFLRNLGKPVLDRVTALAEMERRTEATIVANKSRQAQIDGQISQLDAAFREQQKELAALVEPLKGISIDLATIIPYFSLILGLIFVALTARLASRIHDLGAAVALVTRVDPENPAQEWLRSRVAASLWHRQEGIFARYLVLTAWVALASWQLADASLISHTEVVLFGLVGTIGITGASLYEWRVVRSLRAVRSGS